MSSKAPARSAALTRYRSRERRALHAVRFPVESLRAVRLSVVGRRPLVRVPEGHRRRGLLAGGPFEGDREVGERLPDHLVPESAVRGPMEPRRVLERQSRGGPVSGTDERTLLSVRTSSLWGSRVHGFLHHPTVRENDSPRYIESA